MCLSVMEILTCDVCVDLGALWNSVTDKCISYLFNQLRETNRW